MPILVVGMHRSGTSMITRMLNLAGVYLGPEEDLLPPVTNDNDKGFWENFDIAIKVNEGILNYLGGSWKQPPIFYKDWQKQPELAPFREEATKVIDMLREKPLWGWKDPRTSLMLSFWRDMVGDTDLKLVVCLRSPVAVAKSLTSRGDTVEQVYSLWSIYNRQMMDDLAGLPYIITHYDSYFQDARTEFQRLTDFLGLEVSEEIVQQACDWIEGNLRRQMPGLEELAENDVPFPVIEQYLEMCAQAGPVYAELFRQQLADSKYLDWSLPLSDTFKQKVMATRLLNLSKEKAEADERIAGSTKYIAELEEMVRKQDGYIKEREALIKEREAVIAEVSEMVRKQDGYIKERDLKIATQDSQLEVTKDIRKVVEQTVYLQAQVIEIQNILVGKNEYISTLEKNVHDQHKKILLHEDAWREAVNSYNEAETYARQLTARLEEAQAEIARLTAELEIARQSAAANPLAGVSVRLKNRLNGILSQK
jgi:exonuclease VII small subunit